MRWRKLADFPVPLIFMVAFGCLTSFGSIALHDQGESERSTQHTLTPEDVMRQVDALIILKDPLTADALCVRALKKWPQDPQLIQRGLATKRKMRDKSGLMRLFFSHVNSNPELKAKQSLVEELSWGLIEWGSAASTEAHRQMALISAAISMQSEGVLLLEQALESNSYNIRGLAVHLCRVLRDSRLERVLTQRLKEEADGQLRIQIIEALSEIGGNKALSALKEMILSGRYPEIEKQRAQAALLQMPRFERSEEVLETLSSKSPGLRAYGARLALHRKTTEATSRLKQLVSDPFASVRLEALYALSNLPNKAVEEGSSVKDLLNKALEDSNPSVQMLAARELIAKEPKAKEVLRRWLFSGNFERARQAAGLLCSCGAYGLDLVIEGFQKSQDAEVKMLLAQALLIERTLVESAGGYLKSILVESSSLLDEKHVLGIFDVIAPSKGGAALQARGKDLSARLHLIDLILASGYNHADELLRPFLQSRQWGSILGVATLMVKREPEYALSKIAEFLDDERLHIRAEAAIICSALKADPKAAAVLKEVFHSPQASRELKLYALEALMHFPGKRDIQFFLDALSTPYESLQLVLAGCILSSLNH